MFEMTLSIAARAIVAIGVGLTGGSTFHLASRRTYIPAAVCGGSSIGLAILYSAICLDWI